MKSSPYKLRSSTSTAHNRSSNSRSSAKAARDRFQQFLESEAESLCDNAENELPNGPPGGHARPKRQVSRLTVQSSEDDLASPCEQMHTSSVGRSRGKIHNHDMFALQGNDASRHFSRSHDRGRKQTPSIELRHSQRIRKRAFAQSRRPFYLDEVDENGDCNEDEYEHRSLSAYQRYNLRDRKPFSRSSISPQNAHSATLRYNLRPHRGTRAIHEYEVPWSVAEQYILSDQPSNRQLIHEKAIIEATPELQPYGSQADPVPRPIRDSVNDSSDDGDNDEDGSDSSCAGSESIITQTVEPSSASEVPFSRIAGMDEYIKQLKEMVVFPLLYPSFFNRLGISPPRGVLFYGPPGTGKTLMARLLAESCSTTSRKVSFFMRNGSDCLSKWIGEAERNMKLLFQKAKECQPSIIFFDEIDGLAPERSARADQSHISLVSTLLALMDGLDDRGNVVVIGATNRIHALDPALRRPGRFDREFFFGLPSEPVRLAILEILTRSWDPHPDRGLLSSLAEMTLGFSGADLKGLCTEAALYAIRRIAPEAYESAGIPSESHFVNRKIVVENPDFYMAFKKVVPSTRRRDMSEQLTFPLPFSILFSKAMDFLVEEIKKVVGTPITINQHSLQATSPWIFEKNILRLVADSLPHSVATRLMKLACSQIQGFNSFVLGEKLDRDQPLYDQLLNGIFREARLHAPSFIIVTNAIYDDAQVGKEFELAVPRLIGSILPTDPVLVIELNGDCQDTDDYSVVPCLGWPELYSFIEHVVLNELKGVVTEKLSRIEAIIEYGRSVDVDLSMILVSPFPDYEVFTASLSILDGHAQAIVEAVDCLVVLSNDDWYRSQIPHYPSFEGDRLKTDIYTFGSQLRQEIIRGAQNMRIPTPATVGDIIRNTVRGHLKDFE